MNSKEELKEELDEELEEELEEEEKKRYKFLIILLLLLLIIIITVAISYSFFNYTRSGSTDNTITTDAITFVYDEKENFGNGIIITEALPMSDSKGMVQMGTNNVFDFKILAESSSDLDISYEITAKKKNTSDNIDKNIKLYLTEVTNDNEIATPLTMNRSEVKKYSELLQTSVNVGENVVEKTIYQGIVPSNTLNYEKNFRLRMWISDDTDYSPIEDKDGNIIYPMNNKKFSITVNVYANSVVINTGD